MATAPVINLVSKKKDRFDKQAALAVRARVWAGIVLVVYAVILVGVIAVVAIFSVRIESATQALNRAKLTLASQSLVIQQYEQIHRRLGSIKTLFAERREVIDLWSNIRTMLPEGCELTGFTMAEGVLNVVVTAPHVLVANQLVDRVEQGLDEFGISKTEVAINRSGDASYRISMVMTLASNDQGEQKTR